MLSVCTALYEYKRKYNQSTNFVPQFAFSFMFGCTKGECSFDLKLKKRKMGILWFRVFKRFLRISIQFWVGAFV